MNYSLINGTKYRECETEIRALVVGVGSFEPINFGDGIYGLRGVDIRQLDGVETYMLPVRPADESETNYVNRVAAEVNAQIEQLKFDGSVSAIYISDEYDQKLFDKYKDKFDSWPERVGIFV